MQLSARNQLEGTITAIKRGTVMTEVTIRIGSGQELVAAITRGSADQLNLTEGATVVAVIKATEVMVAIP